MQTDPDTTGPKDITAESLFGPLPTSMEQFNQLIQAATSASESGKTLGDVKQIARQDLNTLYDQALALCEKEEWSEAALIAVQLSMHDIRNPRFLFLTGTCLQRLQQMQMAAGVFGLALMEREEPITLFRLAECLAASGAFGPARQAFDACYDMCRGDFVHRELQDACADALGKLKPH